MTGPQSSTVRIAAIDMGSNTTRLLVADVTRHADGSCTHEPVVRHTTITRLAEEVDARGILLPRAIARTRNALTSYNRELRSLGAVFALATATSAVRDADNGDAFLGEVEHSYGFRTALLSGDDEALTTWAGVTSGGDLARRTRRGAGLLIDIGGGSTEIVLTHDGEVVDHHSFQLGSVRLTEQVLAGEGEPPSARALARANERARELLSTRFPDPPRVDLAVGVAGTITTVVAVRERMKRYNPMLIHNAELDLGEIRSVRSQLASLSIDARRLVPGLEPERAAVIVGGVVVLEAVLEHFGLDRIVVSERDILDGIALWAGRIALDAHITELPEPFGRTPC